MSSLRVAPLRSVRDTIARLLLDPSDADLSLGDIQLHPHQRSAVSRLRQSISEFGGAILSDPVGTGKTYIGLAVTPSDARLLIVAPAVLRDMWMRALSITDRVAGFSSFESLSRGSPPSGQHDFVIVDEAHHARNPKTARFKLLSEVVAHSEVILLTATPIHNRRTDLVALLSLFLGERAGTLTSAEVSRCLLRRDALLESAKGMPATDPVTWVRMRDDHHMPEILLSLPPPLPPRDGSDGGALIAHSLIRQWASSDAALIGALKRRLVRAESLSAALADGTWPSRSELVSWIAGDDGVQLGFAGMLASGTGNTGELLRVVSRHIDGLRQSLARARESNSDSERAALIRKIRSIHSGRSIVAFSQYADTVEGLFARLSHDGQVCVLHGSGARVAGGLISRAEAIGRFAPTACGRATPKGASAVTLLLTTDLLSEGVNLQDAGVVIHLDLPWTPARMEQRLGRIARVGSPHERVQSYAILPPISANETVRIEGILRSKMEAAGAVMTAFPSLTGFSSGQVSGSSDPQRSEEIRKILSCWMIGRANTDFATGVVAAVPASTDGFLAVATDRGSARVVARVGERISEAPTVVLEALSHFSSSTALDVSQKDIDTCGSEAIDWIEAANALQSTHGPAIRTPVRSAVARRISGAVRRARSHERASIAEKAERALGLLAGNLGVHDEGVIAQACRDISDDETLLNRVTSLARKRRTGSHAKPQILAMLIMTRR